MEKRTVLPGKHGCWFYVDSVVAMDNRTSLGSPTVTLVSDMIIFFLYFWHLYDTYWFGEQYELCVF